MKSQNQSVFLRKKSDFFKLKDNNKIICKNCDDIIAFIISRVDRDAFNVIFVNRRYQTDINQPCLNCNKNWV